MTECHLDNAVVRIKTNRLFVEVTFQKIAEWPLPIYPTKAFRDLVVVNSVNRFWLRPYPVSVSTALDLCVNRRTENHNQPNSNFSVPSIGSADHRLIFESALPKRATW